jgi:hypothetical protein
LDTKPGHYDVTPLLEEAAEALKPFAEDLLGRDSLGNPFIKTLDPDDFLTWILRAGGVRQRILAALEARPKLPREVLAGYFYEDTTPAPAQTPDEAYRAAKSRGDVRGMLDGFKAQAEEYDGQDEEGGPR